MDVRDQIALLEPRLRDARVSVARVCREAGISQTTWMRWKAGVPARPNNWARIETAVTLLAPQLGRAA